jgi:phenylacetate-CoA ligase
MLRYRTRDLSRLYTQPCPCGRTIRRFERIRARTDDMLIIRGVNVFPSQIEAALLTIGEVLPHYLIVIDRVGDLDALEIKVEIAPDAFSDDIKSLEALRARIGHAIQRIININARITLAEPHTLPRSEGKINRVRDLRKK